MDGIRRFATILDKIVDIARSNASKLLKVHCPRMDRLEIRNQYGDSVHALPADSADRWEKTRMGVVSTQGDASDKFKHGDGGIGLDDRYDLDTTQTIRLPNQTTLLVPLTIVATAESARIEVRKSHHCDFTASSQGTEKNQGEQATVSHQILQIERLRYRARTSEE
jgi:hypothetical protein